MSVLEALLLGIVQGLTEFLPISSSGHLILVPWLQDYTFLRENEAFNKTFDVALHIGTAAAVIYYFRKELWRMFLGFFASLRRRSIEGLDERMAWVVAVGTIPAVIVGGLGAGWIDDNLGEPWMIGIQLIVFGVILWAADQLPQRRSIDKVRIRDGLYVGLAQAVALAPGTSRSGITITMGRILGFDREAAARVGFLLLVPVTIGAGIVKTYEALDVGLPSGVALPMIVGMITAAITGFLAIAWLLRYVTSHSYDIFVIYRILVGAGVLILIATGAREATF
ncbi:MAG: undecaprenyl-diphosphatase UppP [Solirubrobacterales bacterium]